MASNVHSSRAVRSDLEEETKIAPTFNTFVLKTLSANSDILPAWFVFYARLIFKVRKYIPAVPSFVYNSRKNERNDDKVLSHII